MSPPDDHRGVTYPLGWGEKCVDAVMGVLVASFGVVMAISAISHHWFGAFAAALAAFSIWLSWTQVPRLGQSERVAPCHAGEISEPPRWLIFAIGMVGVVVGAAGAALVIGGVWLALGARIGALVPIIGAFLSAIVGVLMLQIVVRLSRFWSAGNVTQVLGAAFFFPSLYLVWITANAFPDELWPLRVWAIVVALVCRRAFYVTAFMVCRRLFPAARVNGSVAGQAPSE